jgi:WD40 repeat protein
MSVVIDPDGKTAVSGSLDRTVKLWDLNSGKLRRTFAGDSGPIDSLAIDPNGQVVASGSRDGMIRIWDLDTGELLRSLPASSSVYSVAISPDGRRLVSGSENGAIKLWDLKTGEQLRTFRQFPNFRNLTRTLSMAANEVWSVTISPDGQRVASSGSDELIRLWDLNTGKLLHIFDSQTAGIPSVVFTPSGQTLVSGSRSGNVKLWNIQ